MRGLTEFKLRRTVKLPGFNGTERLVVVLVPKPYQRAPAPSATGIAAAVADAIRRHKPKLRGSSVRITIEDLQVCRKCGCTEDDACEGGCWWVESDLCSSCSPSTPADVKKARRR